jgi:hypothetical protein
MDDLIATALRERAEGDIHVERLLGAVRAGVRRQRRRRFAVGCGAVAVAGLVAAVGVAVAPGRGPGTVAAPPPVAAFPRPPAAAAPTAADAPDVLASDPTLFHLDVADMSGWSAVSWAATTTFEEMTVQASEAAGTASVTASRDPEWVGPWGDGAVPATVGGVPAQIREHLGRHVVRWQPIPGIWAQVSANGPADIAIGVAGKVRFDRVYRCAVPFRLVGLGPPRAVKCTTDFVLEDDGATVTAAGGVWFTAVQGGPEYQIAVGRARPGVTPNDTVAGKPVLVSMPIDSVTPPEILYPFDGRMAYFWQHGAGPVEAFRAVVAAFVPVPGRDPLAWPSSPFGP